MALSVPLSRFTSRVGGGSAFFVRRLTVITHKIMKPEPQTLAEYKIAYGKLKADFVALETKFKTLETEFENYKVDAEEIVRRLKAKQRPPEDPPRGGITPVRFS